MLKSLKERPFSAREGGQFCFKLHCFYLVVLKCVAAANSHYFLFMKEEILVCFEFEFNLLATLALVVGSSTSLSLGFPLKEFLVITSALGTIFLSTLLVVATLKSVTSDLLQLQSCLLSWS